jgi:hypothetical protein
MNMAMNTGTFVKSFEMLNYILKGWYVEMRHRQGMRFPFHVYIDVMNC